MKTYTREQVQKLRAINLAARVLYNSDRDEYRVICPHERDPLECSLCEPVAQNLLGESFPSAAPAFRVPMAEILLRFAEELAQRSTCERLRVGAVVTDADQLQVLGIGYNGNASGLPNQCDSAVPGACGCLHAEINALLKSPGTLPGKHLFVTNAPCAACAKAAINARIVAVHYRAVYRDPSGLEVLRAAGVASHQLAPGWWLDVPSDAPSAPGEIAPQPPS